MTAPALTQAETSETYVSDEAARAEYIAAARSAAWRRRLLPAAAAILLLVLWELAVIVFHVRPFIAPAPTAVAATLYAKFGLLIGNLVPTATEAVAGFIIGNAAAIVIATVFVYQRTAEEAFFSDSSNYTANVAALKFSSSTGVGAPAIVTGAGFWTATVTHTQIVGSSCAIGVNTTNPLVATASDGTGVCQ